MVEFVEQSAHVDELRFGRADAIDLTIDAIEVADLVGIEIHPDGDAAAPATDDRVDEAVRLEGARVGGNEGIYDFRFLIHERAGRRCGS